MPIPLPDTGSASSDVPALQIEQAGTGEGLVVRSAQGAAVVAAKDVPGGAALHARLTGGQGTAVRAEGGLAAVAALGETWGVMASGSQVGCLGAGEGVGVGGMSVNGAAVKAVAGDGVGVHAQAAGVGVYAESGGDNAVLAMAATPEKAGVFGVNTGIGGVGVVGLADARGIGVIAQGGRDGLHATGQRHGVVAEGVRTAVDARSTAEHGVRGTTASPEHAGVAGHADVDGGKEAAAASGVLGTSLYGAGVRGRSVVGPGVHAESEAGSAAVLRNAAGDAPAVEVAAEGGGAGVRVSSAEGGIAVVRPDRLAWTTGVSVAANAPVQASGGVYIGPLAHTFAGDYGVTVERPAEGLALSCMGDVSVFDGNVTLLAGDVGLLGGRVRAVGSDAGEPTIHGQIHLGSYEGDAPTATGVKGTAIYLNGSARGVTGVAGEPERPRQWAGFFVGNVKVIGTIYKSDVCFEIDHPREPTQRYLRHVAVESDERRTLYDGEAVLDERGCAAVRMPAWFDALNRRPRYQLTPVGQPAPGLYVAREHPDGFEIAGGAPGQRVHWQVTAVRDDPWARAHPFQVEVDKDAAARGTYLHPESHGAPPEQGEAWPDLQAARTPAPRGQRPAAPAGRAPARGDKGAAAPGATRGGAAVRVQPPTPPVTPPLRRPELDVKG